MNRNVVIGIVVVLSVLVLGWWIFAFMLPTAAVPLIPGSATEDTERPGEDQAFSLSGTWRSTEDARFVRTFSADGTVTDRYEGDERATVSGSWNAVEDLSQERPGLPDVGDMRVIKVQFPEEVMYFSIIELTATELSMSLLGGNGSTLSFTRVQ